jgi:tripartite-type tricarboxylate transporter receptor subunit TctC
VIRQLAVTNKDRMKHHRRNFFCLAAGAAALPVVSRVAWAQSYPARPVRLIVPYAAGGGTDAIARLVAQAVGEKLGQTVVVENNGVGAGNVATQTAALAAPDGYTILMANQGPMVVNPHLFKSMKVDPLIAFDPVCLIAIAPLVVVVRTQSQFTSFTQLIEAARAKPGTLTYGSAGNGSASHLATVLLNVVAKLDTVHVPYRGAGPALSDLIGGQTQFMITTLPSVTGLIDGKQVRPLAVTTKTRSSLFAEVPTIAENGWPDYEAGAWYGFVVPKRTPSSIVETIRKATVDAVKGGALRERFASEGAEPIGNTPQEFAAFMKVESARWATTVKAAGISLE